LRELQAQLEVCRGEQEKLKANENLAAEQLFSITQTANSIGADLGASKAVVEMLTAKSEEKNKQIKEVATAIQSGKSSELNREDYGEFTELLAAVEEKVGKSSSNFTDFCYLNYFVGFFFKELSQASKVQKEALINKVQTLNAESLEPFLTEIFKVLEGSGEAGAKLKGFVEAELDLSEIEKSIQLKFKTFYERHKANIKYFIYFLFIARRYILDNKQQGLCKPSKFLDIIHTGASDNTGEYANASNPNSGNEATSALGLQSRPGTARGKRELPGPKRAATALEAQRAITSGAPQVPGTPPRASTPLRGIPKVTPKAFGSGKRTGRLNVPGK
jgi:hypothetical protein